MSKARWYAKANAYAAGWKKGFGDSPSTSNVALGLSVAQLETSCGDAWPGAFNWGAVQRRTLSSSEKLVLSSVKASLSNLSLAKSTLNSARASGTLPAADSRDYLWVDTSPVNGAYWIYFWAFPNDDEGAAFFINTLAAKRPGCKSVLVSANPTASDLASAMYSSKYYEGFHDPSKPGGAQSNINDYSAGISRNLNSITNALSGWSPGATPPPVTPSDFDLKTVLGIQQALNWLHVVPVSLAEDGVSGPSTKSAIIVYQKSQGLTPDGVVGPRTIAAISKSLGL